MPPWDPWSQVPAQTLPVEVPNSAGRRKGPVQVLALGSAPAYQWVGGGDGICLFLKHTGQNFLPRYLGHVAQ